MPPNLRERFEAVLLQLPEWCSGADSRRAWLLRVLSHHDIKYDLWYEGGPRVAAGRLLDLGKEHGLGPFQLLLKDLLLNNRAMEAARREEIERLQADLSRAGELKRRPWKGAPYLGLRHHGPEDAPLFFGRDKEVEALLTTMSTAAREDGPGFTLLAGASGAGKSSLAHAGVWARLSAGAVPAFPGSEQWLITSMRPNGMGDFEASLRASLLPADTRKKQKAVDGMSGCSLSVLAEQLLPPEREARWLLILDQMEELFTDPKRKAEAERFLDKLFDGVRPGGPSRLLVLATIRSDFEHHCLEGHRALSNAICRPGGRFPLRAPGRLALEKMISGPLTDLELEEPCELDPELAPAMAAEADSQPGGLALLAFALERLYLLCRKKRRPRMDLETYHGAEFGGLRGAIARHADATLAALGEGGEAALKRVFAGLVRTRPDEPPTRMRKPRPAWAGDAKAIELVDSFVDERLLVSDGGMVEVAHETLLREWPRLAGWIEERREAFWLADRVREQAREWREDERRYERPWTAATIEEYRRKLSEAGLLDDLCREDPKIARLMMAERDWIMGELDRTTTSGNRRFEIGVRLNDFGDERPGLRVVGGVPEILWRKIPGGGVEVETVGRRVVKEFKMAAYPITFGQFRAFLGAKDGFENKKWWKGLEREDPDPAWQTGLANHPVTNVSWYDATAFCLWLRTRTKEEVRLPDEAEWQWAAQSARPDYAYPWGSDWDESRANTHEAGPRRLAAAGLYPLGRSDQDVEDLAGTVWEWCENWYDDKRESRGLRGGSWINHPEYARAVYRNLPRPDVRFNYIGFRVVCSSPIR